MKSKELKTYNLPADNPIISQIDAKPSYVFVILMFLGFISFLLDVPETYGIVTIVLSFICLIYLPRVVLMEFYQDYLVAYNKADRSKCVLIYYDEIAFWYYQRGSRIDYLIIALEDGRQETIEAFSRTVFESSMNRFVKEKKRVSK